MIDNLTMFLLEMKPYLQLLLIALCIAKLLLFMLKKKKSWSIYDFFYFHSTHVILSHSKTSYNNKKLQNNLTIIITFVTVFLILNTFLSIVIYN